METLWRVAPTPRFPFRPLAKVTAFAEKGFHWGQLALSNLYASGTFCAQDQLQSEKWAAAAESSKADADIMSQQDQASERGW